MSTAAIRRWEVAGLGLCFLVALVCRLGFQASYRERVDVDTRRLPNLDTGTFDKWARGIQSGDLLSARFSPPTDHWWARRIADPETWRDWLPEKAFHQSPLYAYLLGAAYAVFGTGWSVVPTLQALLGALTASLVFCLTRRHGGFYAAVVAGLLAATVSPSVFFSQFLLRASLLEFVAVGVLFSIDGARRREAPSLRDGALGLGIGLAILAKPVFLLFLAVAAVSLFAPSVGTKVPANFLRSGRRLGLVIAGIFVALLPVLVRNLVVGAPPFSLSTRGPAAFVNGNASASDGVEWFPERTRVQLLDVQARNILEEVGWNLSSVVGKTLETHEGFSSYFRLLGAKARALLRADEAPNNLDFAAIRGLVPFLNLLPDFRVLGALGLCGFVVSFARWRSRSHLLLFAVLFSAVTLGFFILGRFRLPLFPVGAVFGGLFLEFAMSRNRVDREGDRIEGRKRILRGLSGLALLGGALWICWPREEPSSPRVILYDLGFRVVDEARFLGASAEGAEKFSRALGLFETVTKTPAQPGDDPLLPLTARAQMAKICLENLGRIDEAQRHFERALTELATLDPTKLEHIRAEQNIRASLGGLFLGRYRRLGRVKADALRARRELEHAAKIGERARSLSPHDLEIQVTGAWVECALASLLENPFGERNLAESHYRNALQISPGYPGAQFGIARIGVEKAREKLSGAELKAVLLEARDLLEKARRSDPLPERPEVMDDLLQEVEAKLKSGEAGDKEETRDKEETPDGQ